MERTNDKMQLRRDIRSARTQLGEAERAEAHAALTNRLLNLPAIKHAKTIGAYKAYGAEASLDAFIEQVRKLDTAPRIALPIVISDIAMVFMRLDANDDIEQFSNPMEIVTDYDHNKLIPAESFDLLLVPGIAFDAKCRRLGQGGGYYDRYLPLVRQDCLVVGIAFDEQIVDEVPTESFDHKVDYVVTPTQIFAA